MSTPFFAPSFDFRRRREVNGFKPKSVRIAGKAEVARPEPFDYELDAFDRRHRVKRTDNTRVTRPTCQGRSRNDFDDPPLALPLPQHDYPTLDGVIEGHVATLIHDAHVVDV